MKSVLSILLLAACLAGVAQAKHEDHGKDWEARLAATLALTPEQQAKVSSIRKVHREKFRTLKDRISEAKQELVKAMQVSDKSEGYGKELRAKFAKVQELKREQATARFEKALAIRDVLNAEQLGKFRGMGSVRRDGAKGEDR